MRGFLKKMKETAKGKFKMFILVHEAALYNKEEEEKKQQRRMLAKTNNHSVLTI